MTWTHVVDPPKEQLAELFPYELHPVAVETLTLVRDFDEHVYTNLESHDLYLAGEIAIPVEDDSPDRLGTVGLRIIADFDRLVTVINTPRRIPPEFSIPNLFPVVERAHNETLSVGEQLWLLLDHVVTLLEKQLDEALEGAEALEAELDSGEKPPDNARQLISDIRHALLGVQELANPLLELSTRIIDDELDLRDNIEGTPRELFERPTEIRVMDVRAQLRNIGARVEYGLQVMTALSDSLKEFLAREQADAGNRMAAVASIMLLPTFVVGLYGMNIDPDSFPEMGFLNGYLFAWGLIVVLTLAQVWLFRRKKWI